MGQREGIPLASERSFHIADWLVEPWAGRVSNGPREARFEPKVMQVLVLLAKRSGRTVSRDELIEGVWNGTAVSEDAVNRCISRLRRAFRDDGSVRIETLPKIGYRLIGDIRQADFESTEAPGDSSPPAAPIPQSQEVSQPARHSGQRWFLIGGLLCLALLVFFWTVPSENDKAAAEFRVTPFTSLPGHETMASFSPEGGHIAFTRRQPRSDTYDVYVKSVGSDDMLRLTTDPAHDLNPVWSPDGSRIAFVRLKDGQAQLLTVPSLGGSERRITTYAAPDASELSWHPDGDGIAFSGQKEPGKEYEIYLASLSTGSVRSLTSPPASWIGDYYPCFSPDGSRLAFVRYRAMGVSDIHVLHLGTQETTQLTFDNLKVHGLAWESKGDGLIFSSNRGGSSSLWRIGLNQRRPTPLPFGGRHVGSVAVSTSANRLVYQELMATCGLLRLDLSSSQPVPALDLAGSMRFDWDPEMSPDGRRMAFLSDRSGSAEVWVSDPEGDHRLQITSFGGPYVKTVSWSPDGRSLVLTAPPAGQFDVFLADPDGGGVRRLTSDEADDYAPAWSPDGANIYFSSNRSGRWEIWVMSRDGRQARQITRNGGKAGLPSPDGRWIYYVKPDQPGIWRQLAEPGAKEQMTAPDLQPVDWNNWEVTPQGIFFVTRPTLLTATLHFFNPETGERREVMSLPRMPDDSGIDISPDGRSLLIASVAKSESDLILVQYATGGN